MVDFHFLKISLVVVVQPTGIQEFATVPGYVSQCRVQAEVWSSCFKFNRALLIQELAICHRTSEQMPNRSHRTAGDHGLWRVSSLVHEHPRYRGLNVPPRLTANTFWSDCRRWFIVTFGVVPWLSSRKSVHGVAVGQLYICLLNRKTHQNLLTVCVRQVWNLRPPSVVLGAR